MIAVYEKLKSNGITVTLDGHGADDMLSGYGHLLETLWDNWANAKVVNEVIETHQNTILDDDQFKKYNKLIRVNNLIKHEKLFRKDHKYDLLIPIKYNFNKPKTGHGSCIFIHLTMNYKPTAGCVALKKKDFLIMLKLINKNTKIKII